MEVRKVQTINDLDTKQQGISKLTILKGHREPLGLSGSQQKPTQGFLKDNGLQVPVYRSKQGKTFSRITEWVFWCTCRLASHGVTGVKSGESDG